MSSAIFMAVLVAHGKTKGSMHHGVVCNPCKPAGQLETNWGSVFFSMPRISRRMSPGWHGDTGGGISCGGQVAANGSHEPTSLKEPVAFVSPMEDSAVRRTWWVMLGRVAEPYSSTA